MKILISLAAALALLVVAYVGVEVLQLTGLFGMIIPTVAVVVFLGGIVYRMVSWARRPVPFRIPTTCGQQKTLPWIKDSPIENPSTTLGVITRMALEILFFRSLMRNTKTEVLPDGPKVTYGSDKWLWAAALAFHWGFLVILFRHLRFFTEPVPGIVTLVESLDGFLQVGVPVYLLTGFVVLAALTFLFLRRVVLPQVRYISLPADYLPLFILLGIIVSGIFLRHVVRTDIVGVKQIAMGIVSFQMIAVEGIHWLFYVHIFFVSCLLIYFPFSKLMHLGGVFLSPTRNLANTNRMVRHINPWNPKVKTHPYEEYEDDFRDKMKAAGIPVDKE